MGPGLEICVANVSNAQNTPAENSCNIARFGDFAKLGKATFNSLVSPHPVDYSSTLGGKFLLRRNGANSFLVEVEFSNGIAHGFPSFFVRLSHISNSTSFHVLFWTFRLHCVIQFSSLRWSTHSAKASARKRCRKCVTESSKDTSTTGRQGKTFRLQNSIT